LAGWAIFLRIIEIIGCQPSLIGIRKAFWVNLSYKRSNRGVASVLEPNQAGRTMKKRIILVLKKLLGSLCASLVEEGSKLVTNYGISLSVSRSVMN